MTRVLHNIATRRPILPGALIAAGLFLNACTATRPPEQSPAHLSRAAAATRDIPTPVQQAPFVPVPKPAAPQETFTVTVTDVPVKELLFALARDAKLNLDIHPNVAGTVTLNAVKQTLPQILNRIAEQVSLRYDVIGPNLVVSPDVAHVRTYKIDYLNMTREAKSTVSVATEISTTGGSVGQGGGGGSTGNKSNTEVTISTTNNFWELLVQNINGILGAGEGQVIANPLSSIVSVRATSRQHQQVQAFIDRLMANVQRQVLVEATIVEVELGSSYQSGVDWNLISQSNGFSAASNMIGGNLATPPALALTYDKATGSFDTVFAALKMLEKFGDVKVLSSPKIMALNNQTALLKVVDEKVYFTVTREEEAATDNSPAKVTFTSEVHTVPVGLIMSVTPQITDDDRVTVNVRPTISRITGFAIDPAPRLANVEFDNLIPEIQIREMESLLKVDSGQIVVLGGLMQNRVSKDSSGVPLLSRLPWIGHLFSYKSDEYTKTELVIFLRPTVMRNAALSAELKEFQRFLPELAQGAEAIAPAPPADDAMIK
jgi:general secretion pathway protein D